MCKFGSIRIFCETHLFCSLLTSDNNPNLLPVGDGFGFVFFYAYPNFNSKIDRFVR